ncbi:glycosyltransferase family 4 protein [Clostridium prolinivorans]|uniref:glycosyltransferase family 4 protein n=1 Tax=Clostridium prolinivorans TaxID=2769420 RepID=UPI000FD7FE79|nr:glycosyltransferase family 4 protein [Clostridium prolinivorans]
MKICYLADAGSIHTQKLCKYFAKKGYEITVISLSPGNIDGVKVYNLGLNINDIKQNSILHKTKYITCIFKIINIVKKIKPDILHAHYASSYGLLGSLCFYKPYIISVWGSDIYEFPNINFICKNIIKFNLSRVDKILSTSKAMAKETQKYTSKQIEITPFGVDLNLFKNKEKVKKDYITIGTIKTLESNYGIDYLIKAFAIVKKQIENIKLEIAGEGSQREYLENLAKSLNIDKDVTFLGYLSQEEVADRFNNFDIAVFPSCEIESFGVAAVEAQACGVPVITTNIGGLVEAAKPGYSSIVVEKKSEKSLADAMIKLINDEKLRIEMGKNGRKYVEENYNIQENFKLFDSIYKEILKEKNI